MNETSTTESLKLGFTRGTAPNKWAKRWAAAHPNHRLELLPLDFSGQPTTPYGGQHPGQPDVILERVSPGQFPAGSIESPAEPQTRRAVRLYTEGVALVVAADHELAEYAVADRDTLDLVRLLDHPDHLAEWPAAEPWQEIEWMPRHAGAAMELVATGAGAILLPLPLARHLGRGREHVVIPVECEPQLAGTEIWASWDIVRDSEDVQQLIGVMRGRTARSSRGGELPDGNASQSAQPANSKPQKTPHSKSSTQRGGPSKSSRGAQLQNAAKKPVGAKAKQKSATQGSSKRRGSRGSR